MANTTWNPSDKSVGITLSGGNLVATWNAGGGPFRSVRAVDKQVTGKYYWEVTYNTAGSASCAVGIASPNLGIDVGLSSVAIGSSAVNRNGTVLVDGLSTGVALGAWSSGAVICIAVDAGARLIWFRIGAAGNWNANAANNPATGVGGVAIGLGAGIPIYPAGNVAVTSDQFTANFGDSAFTGAVPSGFTSGFTAGASVPTNALATTAFAEHWLTTDPNAQVTQVLVEHWQSVDTTGLQAVVTQVAVEHWMSVAVVLSPSGGPIITMIH